MKPASFLISAFTVVLSLPLVSCEDAKTTLAKRDEARVRLEQLTAESNDLEQKIQVLKQALPPGIQSTQAALQLAEKNARDLVFVEQQLAKAITSYEETEAALKKLEGDLEGLRKLPKP